MRKRKEGWAKIGERCRVVMKERDLRQNDVAEIMDKHQSEISYMLYGTRDPLDLAAMLSGKYNIPMGYFTQNDDEIHVINNMDLKEYAENTNGMKFYKSGGQMQMEVPLVSVDALGSLGDEFADTPERLYKGQTEFFEVPEVHHGKYLSFKVDGDSMDDGTEEGFRKRDIVLVRELDRGLWTPKLHYNTWPYWVVVFGNNVRLKQIIDQDEEKGTITLHSLNPSPEYTDFTINLDDVAHLYNVVQKKPRPVRYGG